MAPPKELSRYQLSSRLQYQSRTPAFLQRLQNRVQGGQAEDEYEPQYYDDGSGRPPIPVRPDIPERPSSERGSASEDDDDERPQVVVLKEGKHLTATEAENERRKVKGLPLLPTSEETSKRKDKEQPIEDTPPEKTKNTASLSFSSSKEKSSSSTSKAKRKIVTGDNESDDGGSQRKKIPKKKSKREGKSLLSFAEDV
ncbi:hypothetical protein PISMIDRAFT_673118 [Pisolithus microcarpus 441]|uniref:DUF4604 domain-containing protein n=1 Tax=Pisolithus microcarpus 441 TaxID=765257 RepID=A0A0C9ZS35_9AGAM|nr:hypothetical protein BKA83DRAFT_673118 [Pisolithus microcarpus]KIK28874.1 hypothetical protein PISMIDRAFT_673118 [Pisolithus microcarpus 441]